MTNNNQNTNVIPLATAQDWAAQWRESNELKGFLLKRENIEAIFNASSGVGDIRAYLGITPEGKPALMLLGTDANGKDLIDYKNGKYIYDYNKPCPDCCDLSSPMYSL